MKLRKPILPHTNSSGQDKNLACESNRTVTLVAVGDIMLGDTPERSGSGVASMIRRYGPEFPFRYVAREIACADIAFGNLESVVPGSDRWMSSQYVQMKIDPGAIRGLRSAGFNVVSLANNHAMQHGIEGILKTVRLLESQKIHPIGVDNPEDQICNLYVYTKAGIKVSLLGYNCRPPKYSKSPLYVRGDLNRIISDIQSAREKADVCVISIHWGEEFVEHPSVSQVEMAHQLVDAGAHLILGHHPHILQGLEEYGKGLIAYSLGNFVFDFWQPRLRKTIILKCRFSKNRIVGFEVIPVFINDSHQPRILTEDASSELLSEFAELSSLIPSREISPTVERTEEYETLVKHRLKQFRREIYLHYFVHLWRKNMRAFLMNLLAAVLRRLFRLRHK